MAHLVLHVGSHKTGTTYLQNLFHRNRATLEAAGIYYPDIGPNTAHHVLARPWLTMPDVPDSFFGARGPEGVWEDLIAQYAHLPGTVFLSGENFSRSYPETVDMEELAQRLSVFEGVRILYTMRAQTEMIQSLWLQLAKSGHQLSLYTYVRNTIEKRRAIGVWIDHNAVYDALLMGFAPEQIHFLDYGQIKEMPGGVAQTVLNFLGSDLNSDDLLPPDSEDTNVSPDPLGFWIASEMAGPDVPDPALLAAVTRPLAETGRPNTLLARHEYAKVSSRYGAANVKLVERLQATQPGFEFLQTDAPEDMLYREEIPNQIWLEIARNVYALEQRDIRKGASVLNRTKQHLGRLLHRNERL